MKPNIIGSIYLLIWDVEISLLVIQSLNACSVWGWNRILGDENPLTWSVSIASKDLHWQEFGVKSWTQELSSGVPVWDEGTSVVQVNENLGDENKREKMKTSWNPTAGPILLVTLNVFWEWLCGVCIFPNLWLNHKHVCSLFSASLPRCLNGFASC